VTTELFNFLREHCLRDLKNLKWPWQEVAMIVLEFRSAEAFQRGAAILAAVGVPFGAEAPVMDFRPHLIWFFQDDIRSPGQREALVRVRSLAPGGRRPNADFSAPNLAVPL
jgi:hypothetical protein